MSSFTIFIGDGEVYMLGRYNYNVPTGAQKANGMNHISGNDLQLPFCVNFCKILRIFRLFLLLLQIGFSQWMVFSLNLTESLYERSRLPLLIKLKGENDAKNTLN